MARKQFSLPNIYIHGIADRGKGVGRTEEGMAVFVDGAVPGDVVDVFVQKKKGGFAEGRVERIVTPSPDRVEAFCEHFAICGQIHRLVVDLGKARHLKGVLLIISQNAILDMGGLAHMQQHLIRSPRL